MNNAVGMHGLPHLPKHHKKERTTLTGSQRSQGFSPALLEESPLPTMRLAVLVAISAIISILLVALYILQR